MTAPLLPLTLRRRDHEPAHAAASRLACRWDALDAAAFCRRMGFPTADLVAGRHVERFAARAGLDPAQVVSASPVTDGAIKRVTLRGQSLLLGDWSLRSRRRCPVCVEEDRLEAARLDVPAGWWATSRLWWEVRSIDACPFHRVGLIDRCAACGTLQGWRRGVLSCVCGAEHGVGAAVSADAALSSYLVGRLACGPAVEVPVLDAMTFADAVRTVELLGASRLDRRSVKPRRTGARVADDRRAGLAMARDWPRGFEVALDRLVATRDAAAPDGLLATYGWVYSEICAGDAPRCATDLVGPVLRRHAVANGVIARDEDRLGATPPAMLTATEAARRIGRSYATARRMLDAAGAVPEGSRRGVAFAIDPSAVAGLEGRGRGASASSRLGVGRTQARALLGRVAGNVAGDPSAAIDGWLSRLRTGSRRSPSGTLVPLPVACRNMSVPLVAACAALEEGSIPVRWIPGGAGLASALVRQTDLAGLRARRDRLSVSEVARRHGVHRDAALHLARAGEFGRRDAAGAVEEEVVREFFERHATASRLARRRRTSSRALAASLAQAGVLPAFGPPECRQILYRLADLPTLH